MAVPRREQLQALVRDVQASVGSGGSYFRAVQPE